MSEVLEGGRAIRVQPGVIGQVANDSLRPYGAKIGPDPASISVASGWDPFEQREWNVLRRDSQCLSHTAINEVHAAIRHHHRHRES